MKPEIPEAIASYLTEAHYQEGFYRGVVPVERIVIDPDQARKYPEEFDPVRVIQIREAIDKNQYPVPPFVTVLCETSFGPKISLLNRFGWFQALVAGGVREVPVLLVFDSGFTLENAVPADLIILAEAGAKIDRLENISPSAVLLEESINDTDKEKVLHDQISLEGQKVPVWVRARRTDGAIVYDVVDGYHRSRVIQRLGFSNINARVSYGMTDEELYDQRVIAANSHGSIKLARTVQWVQRSYAETVWAKEYGLHLSQVLSLVAQIENVVNPGKNLGLDPETVLRIRQWVEEKIVIWRSDVGTVLLQVRAAENSFPEIIEQVRSVSGGGHEGSGYLNQAKFFALVEEVPGDLYLQKEIVKLIKKFNLNSEQTRLVARAYRTVKDKRITVNLLKEDPVNIAKEILGNENIPQPKIRRRKGIIRENKSKVPRSRLPSVLDAKDSQDLQSGDLQWLNLPDISEIERGIVRALFINGDPVESVCRQYNVTEQKLIQLLFSAQQKFRLARENQRILKSLKRPE